MPVESSVARPLIAWFGGILPTSIVGWGLSNTFRLLFCVLAAYQLITLIKDARFQLKRKTTEAANGRGRIAPAGG